MKVKLLCSRSGIDFSQNAGEEIEVSDDEGLRMVEAGQAAIIHHRENTSKKQKVNKATK